VIVEGSQTGQGAARAAQDTDTAQDGPQEHDNT